MPTKTLATALVLAVVVVLAPACTQTSESAKVGKDGKGTITIRTVVNKQMADGVLNMLKEMNMGMGSAADLFAALDPESIKKRLEGKKGVRILATSKEEDEKKGTLTVTIQVGFDSLELLYASGAILGIAAKLEKQGDGNYKFTRELKNKYLPGKDNPEGLALLESYLMFLEPYLAELEISSELILPTSVVETSGEKVTENHVRWVIRYMDLAKPEKRLQTVVFSGKGLEWKPFTVKAADPLAQTTTPSGTTTPSEKPTPEEGEKPEGEGGEDKPEPDDGKADDADK